MCRPSTTYCMFYARLNYIIKPSLLNVCFTAFCNTGQNEPKLPVAVPIIFKTLRNVMQSIFKSCPICFTFELSFATRVVIGHRNLTPFFGYILRGHKTTFEKKPKSVRRHLKFWDLLREKNPIFSKAIG